MAGVLLRPVWPVARREEGASPAVGLRPTSNEATGQTGRNPKGGSPFRSRLRCSLLTDPLRDMLVARASPGPKNPLPQNTSHLGDTTLDFSGHPCLRSGRTRVRGCGGPTLVAWPCLLRPPKMPVE